MICLMSVALTATRLAYAGFARCNATTAAA